MLKPPGMEDDDDPAQMVEDCEKRQEKLSEWEQEFIQSLGEQLQRGKTPSQKQFERLTVIWERVT